MGTGMVTLGFQTPDGMNFTGMPSLKATQVQRVHAYQLLVQGFRRYSVNVGVSPIVDYINFKLNDIPGYTNFTNIYDMYRISKVVMLFKAIGTQVYWGNSSGDVPQITTAFDFNDGSSELAPAQSYETALTTTMTTSFSRTFSPKVAVQVYNGVSAGYLEGSSNQWLDTDYPGIPHYQLVVNTNTTTIDNQFVYSVDALFCLEFKQVRFYASLDRIVDPSDSEERKRHHVIGGGTRKLDNSPIPSLNVPPRSPRVLATLSLSSHE